MAESEPAKSLKSPPYWGICSPCLLYVKSPCSSTMTETAVLNNAPLIHCQNHIFSGLQIVLTVICLGGGLDLGQHIIWEENQGPSLVVLFQVFPSTPPSGWWVWYFNKWNDGFLTVQRASEIILLQLAHVFEDVEAQRSTDTEPVCGLAVSCPF